MLLRLSSSEMFSRFSRLALLSFYFANIILLMALLHTPFVSTTFLLVDYLALYRTIVLFSHVITCFSSLPLLVATEGSEEVA